MSDQTNFQGIIEGLLASGETRSGLAEKVGITRGTLYRLQIGAIHEPKFHAGLRLVEYHQKSLSGVPYTVQSKGVRA